MPISRAELEAVATCCRNGAAMLRLADTGEPDAEKRQRLVRFNMGQAELLVQAAQLAADGAQQIENQIPNREFIERVARDTETLISSLATGRKIDAIKAFRQLTGYGLKESKEAIETVTDRMVGQIQTGVS